MLEIEGEGNAVHHLRVLAAGTARDGRRLDLARRLGAEVTVNVNGQDLVAVSREWSGGDGLDVAFECAGAPRSLDACLGALRRIGTLVQVGQGVVGNPEPTAVAVHAVSERAHVTAGDTVLVCGVGPIGLLVLQVVRAQGGRHWGRSVKR